MLKLKLKKVMLKGLAINFCWLSLCLAGMNTHTEIYGMVSSFDEKNVVLVSEDGRFTVPRSAVPGHTKLEEGRQIRVLVPTEVVMKGYGQMTGKAKNK